MDNIRAAMRKKNQIMFGILLVKIHKPNNFILKYFFIKEKSGFRTLELIIRVFFIQNG